MRKALRAIISLLLLVAAAQTLWAAESTWEYAVQLSAQVQAAPAQIRLSWLQDSTALPNSYTLYRKAPGAASWGTGVVLPPTTTNYLDTNVVAGTAYEYQVVKSNALYSGYGYICAGVELPMVENRGTMLLVVDNTHASQLASELTRLQQDLIGDGWSVLRLDVSRTDSVAHVKSLIQAQYQADPTNVNSVFLFGHVPVPYSGDIVPDGHAPDHQGAWPCDGYYGDMDGTWTDTTVNDTAATADRNHNVPGDGKFDQSSFPAKLKLMVGRVDLANLPGRLTEGGPATFSSEVELLRNYLNKDHKFRNKEFDLPRRAVVGDYFGIRSGEAFAASGWRNFAPFFGPTNVLSLPDEGTWLTTMHTNQSLFAYGCGPGTFTSIGGLGTADAYNDGLSTDIVKQDVKAAFTLLFGSWLGDWDSEDDVMRSVLATSSYGLTCGWSGRPHWFLQHMALGAPIGFGARLTQNNGPDGLYRNQLNTGAGQIHIALMGDPSLRLHPVAPPSNVTHKSYLGHVTLAWAPSSDTVLGYHVYRGASPNGPFARLTTTPVTSTNFMDTSATNAANYMVRAVRLETSASGTYYNLSQGAFTTPAGTERSTNSIAGMEPVQAAPIAAATNAPALASQPSPGTNATPASTDASIPATGTNQAPAEADVALDEGDSPTGAAAIPDISVVDYTTLEMPKVGDHTLHILSPNLLELVLITTKAQDAARVSQWDLVDDNGNFMAPSANSFYVTANGQVVLVSAVGFKRRALYGPLAGYDLRIENCLYLQLAQPISDNQTISVANPDGSLWSGDMQFGAKVDPLRFSPAIHVNQEGYVPKFTKQAMVGYYAGNLGEVIVPASAGFKLVDANSGAQVYQGTLTRRADVGYTYSPTPYQNVYVADFTAFKKPGEYRLVVPGMGASLPFLINDGSAMAFARAYALGLYHQRCGAKLTMPYTRFTHDACHAAPASVPLPADSFSYTWATIHNYALTINDNNPPQVAPALTSADAQLFPFVRKGKIDVSGGHHDAGDYSKYTINSASLIHYLTFAADSLPGVASLDNLGIPESGDHISDVLQEAKWEADFLAKMQDSDGGFYFLVYPVNREYEGDVTPDHGDPQVVWPKTTSVTAASVAALAQIATSPAFKKAYPAAAKAYLQKAQLGWQFLMNAINQYGKNGAYQKITHYGDDFADNDELAWAACQMFLATHDASIHKLLLSWFTPGDPSTLRWGWWHMAQCYGHTIRSYAFAVQSGRVKKTELDPTFLAKCQAEIAAAGDEVLKWSQESSYGTSFPDATKAVQSAGWYFSTDQAFDMAVAYQLNRKPAYLDAIIANMNYEGGCNPVNVCYMTGLGWKRQREVVSQWALNDKRMLAPSGIPVGNVQATFFYLWNYQANLEALCFPSDGAATPYPFYDRWGDAWNVSTEFVILNSARSLGTLGFLAAQTPAKAKPGKAVAGKITLPGAARVGSAVTASLKVPGKSLRGARVVWEAQGQEPTFGATFTFTPRNSGANWVEAEVQWPDGTRAFATGTLSVN